MRKFSCSIYYDKTATKQQIRLNIELKETVEIKGRKRVGGWWEAAAKYGLPVETGWG